MGSHPFNQQDEWTLEGALTRRQGARNALCVRGLLKKEP